MANRLKLVNSLRFQARHLATAAAAPLDLKAKAAKVGPNAVFLVSFVMPVSLLHTSLALCCSRGTRTRRLALASSPSTSCRASWGRAPTPLSSSALSSSTPVISPLGRLISRIVLFGYFRRLRGVRSVRARAAVQCAYHSEGGGADVRAA